MCINLESNRFHTVFEQRIQGLLKDTFPIFQGLYSVQKHEHFYPKSLSAFAPFPLQFSLNYKVSIVIQRLSSTDCNFQRLSRP